MGRAVCTGHCDAVCVARSAHKRVLRAAHRVRPHARCRDRERAVAVAASNGCLRRKQVGRAVHVGGRQSACGRLSRIRLSQAGCAGARNHRSIVRARDRHGHQFGRAVCTRKDDAVCILLPAYKLVMCSGSLVCPNPIGTDAEFAITVTACRISLGYKGFLGS